eukprot:scaffold1362_cov163-Amphora_coffeaeformis.AAC.19
MKGTVMRESRDDTQADLIGELSKSVSRLRSLSLAEYGDASPANLEHTLDAILNMAQKTTFDESLDSLRVARPVQKRNKNYQQQLQVRDKGGRLACGLRLLWCGKTEGREDDFTILSPDPTSLQSKLESKSRGSFWKEDRSKVDEKGENRYVPQQGDCAASSGYSAHSNEDLVVAVSRKHQDDISSLSSDLYITSRSYTYDTTPVTLGGDSHANQCFGDVLSCRTQHRQLPMEESHFSFLDLLSCQRSPGERHQRFRDEFVDDDRDLKILGVRETGNQFPSTRSGALAQSPRSLIERNKSLSSISRVEAEYTPRSDPKRPGEATLFIQSQSRKAKR